MIKAVVFDIDGVLIDSFEANLKFFQNLMSKAGYASPTREQYKPLFHKHMREVIEILTQSKSEEEINKIWEMGRDQDVLYPHELLSSPEGVKETIEQLSNSYGIGIVTNRVKSGIYEVPKLAEIQKYIDVTVAFEDTENHKPHPEPLLLACKRLAVDPSEAVYIGDVENDVIAGKAAGMKTILFSSTPLANTDLYTSVFTEIPKLIATL